MNAAPSPACAMEENAPTPPVATSAPVHEATSLAQMGPDVWVSLTHVIGIYPTLLCIPSSPWLAKSLASGR